MFRQFRHFTLLALLCAQNSFPNPQQGLEITSESANSHAWDDYYQRSIEAKNALNQVISAELATRSEHSTLPAPKGKSFAFPESQPDAWYQSVEAAFIANNLRSFQTPYGGWNKNTDMTTAPRSPGQAFGDDPSYDSTFDNSATTEQMRFLARRVRFTQDATDKQSFLLGLSYILDSQYPNGGWPQVYPLSGKYHDAVTYNDKAQIRILELLDQIATPADDFAWLDDEQRALAHNAIERGIDCLIASQITIDGKLTAWCQQHDAKTLAPAPARAYEMISLSSKESAEILAYLMRQPNPSQEIIRSAYACSAWLEESAIYGYAIKRDSNRALILEPTDSKRPIWARFYEIGTNRPLFGDRDGTIHYDLSEVSLERRRGYDWYSTSPYDVLQDFEKWSAKHKTASL